ncbi:MAG TPA: DUF2911 domain-containing protein [Longimicrobiaceae bacterium]|nr:DUF2911 domain-containing protein [Longimicrobiaceae bacterium]
MRLLLRTAVALAACSGAAGPLQAQEPETGAFVVTIGRDTLAVERYTRTADRLQGEVIGRAPRATSSTYDAVLRPDGSIARIEITTRQLNAPAGAPANRSTVEFGADSATVVLQRGDSVRTQRVPTPHGASIPLVGNSYAVYEQAIMHFRRAAAADSLKMSMVAPGNARSYDLTLRRVGADSLTLSNIAGLQRVHADARGRLLGLDGLQSTQKFIVQRLPTLDLTALGAEFARREAGGQGVGPLSPRDSVTAQVGGARVSVNYGRPYKRGRTILGDVVPWGQVWRTGANQATHFTTDRDLMVGAAHVPAGTYTLWSLPTPQGWQLIINRQTGQWGTEYDARQDLARVPMRVSRTEQPVEQFTIRIVPTGDGGTLHLAWDDTEASVPFVVH